MARNKEHKEIRRVCEVKEGNKWVVTYVDPDEVSVYKWLAHDLTAKKLHKCTYITRITDRNNFDGTRDIVVSYDNGCRNTFTVEQ